jgi:hypothetical protein
MNLAKLCAEPINGKIIEVGFVYYFPDNAISDAPTTTPNTGEAQPQPQGLHQSFRSHDRLRSSQNHELVQIQPIRNPSSITTAAEAKAEHNRCSSSSFDVVRYISNSAFDYFPRHHESWTAF